MRQERNSGKLRSRQGPPAQELEIAQPAGLGEEPKYRSYDREDREGERRIARPRNDLIELHVTKEKIKPDRHIGTHDRAREPSDARAVQILRVIDVIQNVCSQDGSAEDGGDISQMRVTAVGAGFRSGSARKRQQERGRLRKARTDEAGSDPRARKPSAPSLHPQIDRANPV